MISGLSTFARTGLVALGLLTGATTLSLAAPAGVSSSGQDFQMQAGSDVIQVQDDTSQWRRRGAWNGDGEWNDTRVGEGRRGQWREGRRRDWGEFHGRDRFRRYDRGPSLYLDLTPQQYIQPRYYVAPRRQVRGLGRAHVAWCQDRYRSYHAWDNTFQPNYGPRQQCYSPYL